MTGANDERAIHHHPLAPAGAPELTPFGTARPFAPASAHLCIVELSLQHTYAFSSLPRAPAGTL